MRVAILGFGIEGKDALKYFVGKNAEITVFDKKSKEELEVELWITEQGVPLNRVEWSLGDSYLNSDLVGFDLIVRSPGVRPDLPQIQEAVQKGSKLTSTTNIFFEECNAPIIAVTGTKGKGTTASLIAEALKACGKKVCLLGNIGEPMLASLSQTNQSDYVVLELSSFQTMDLHKSPHIAVVTNITSDHMDWHISQEEYEKAKAQLWKHQVLADFLVMNWHDDTSKKLAMNSNGVVVWYSSTYSPETYMYMKENEIWSKDLLIGRKDELIILGNHNLENALAALVVARLTKVDIEKAWKGMTQFKGLEHRLEFVANVNGVTYINDSYATNPEPTIAAIRSFKEKKILILGGSSKNADFTMLAREIAQSNTYAVILIGDEAERIEKSLDENGYNKIVLRISGKPTIRDIIKPAYEMARREEVVILSPACASFGLFENYKDRGKQFKEAVLMLKS